MTDTQASSPVDLRVPADDPWSDLRVPVGWEPIAQVAREVAGQLPDLAQVIVGRIREEVPPYADGAIPQDDVTTSVVRSLEMMLVGIAEHRGPTGQELAVRRALGMRRAAQGLPVDALIEGYHVGYRELWQALVGAVPDGDEQTANRLLAAATTVWRWMHEVTTAIADAHAEAVRSREAHVVGARQRFTELVVTGDLGAEELQVLATTIGFALDGEFQSAVARPEALDGSEARQLQHVLDTTEGVHAVVQRGPAVIVLTQATAEQALTEAITSTLPGASVGIGLRRPGLAGARLSLGDAERAVAVAGAGTATFDDAWLAATLLRESSRLEGLLRVGIDAAAEHGHLAEAVLVFARCGFSVSETARQLQLHANSVSYRLDRWHQLTGWDPRAFDGLARSVTAILLLEQA